MINRSCRAVKAQKSRLIAREGEAPVQCPVADLFDKPPETGAGKNIAEKVIVGDDQGGCQHQQKNQADPPAARIEAPQCGHERRKERHVPRRKTFVNTAAMEPVEAVQPRIVQPDASVDSSEDQFQGGLADVRGGNGIRDQLEKTRRGGIYFPSPLHEVAENRHDGYDAHQQKQQVRNCSSVTGPGGIAGNSSADEECQFSIDKVMAEKDQKRCHDEAYEQTVHLVPS